MKRIAALARTIAALGGAAVAAVPIAARALRGRAPSAVPGAAELPCITLGQIILCP